MYEPPEHITAFCILLSLAHRRFGGSRLPESCASVLNVALNNTRLWVLFGKHVHPTMHDSILSRAKGLRIAPREIQYFTTAEETAYLVVKHEGIAFLNRTSAWRVARDGLTMRPLDEPGIAVRTTLITRADDRTRLTSEYVRSAMRKLQRKRDATQQTLPLAI